MPVDLFADPLPGSAGLQAYIAAPMVPSELEETITDYWYALGRIGGAFRLEDTQYVLQDWDAKAECLKVSLLR